ncbi:MAG TPA: hypothetical protein VFU27_01095 [Terriglobales bacterium]|nr:hypothetical protein [Terriglobales bacterium]
MFTKKLFSGGRIDSDDGFSVLFGRDSLAYRESGRKMSVTVDIGAGEANVFLDSIARWDDDPNHAIGEEAKRRIADNIRRALEWGHLTVRLL